MTLLESLKMILRSRKFWVLIASIVSIAASFVLGEIDHWIALTMLIAALSVYSTGVAIEGPLRK